MGNDEKELDEYGVWVKSGDEPTTLNNNDNLAQESTSEVSLGDENLENITIDLNDEAVNEIEDDSFFELDELDAITGRNDFVPLSIDEDVVTPNNDSNYQEDNPQEFSLESPSSYSQTGSNLSSNFTDQTIKDEPMNNQSHILKNILDEIKNIKSDIDNIKSQISELKKEKSDSEDNDDASMFNDDDESISLSNDELSDVFVESDDVVSADTISTLNEEPITSDEYKKNAAFADDLISTSENDFDADIDIDFNSEFDDDVIDLDGSTIEEEIIKDNDELLDIQHGNSSIFGDSEDEQLDEIDDFQLSDEDFPQMIDTKNYNADSTTLDEDLNNPNKEELTPEDEFVITSSSFDADEELQEQDDISFEFTENSNETTQDNIFDENDISDEPTLQEAVNIDDLEIDQLITDDPTIDTQQVALAAAEAGFVANAPADDDLFNDDLIIEDGLTLTDTLSVTQQPSTDANIQEQKKEVQDESTQLNNKELVDLLGYLDNLLDSLPDEKIKEFANSPYFDLYKKIFSNLGIK